MANVLGTNLLNKLVIYEVDADPSAGLGTKAPIGSMALVNNLGLGQVWQKTGAADTAWTLNATSGGGSSWDLAGNALVGPEFLGSTNAFDVPFRTNNIETARLTQTGGFQNGSVGAGAVFGAIGTGSHVFGDLAAGATLRALGPGGLAHGGIGGVGVIQATGAGVYAGGYVDSIGTIVSSSTGSYSFGNATGGFSIAASAEGGRASGYAVSGSILCSGQASRAHGDNINLSGAFAQAFGIGHVHGADNGFVCGTFALVSGVPGAPAATDTLYAVGNGVIGVPANAFEISRDGHELTTGAEVNQAVRLVAVADAISARTDRTILADLAGAGGALTLPLTPPDGYEITISIANAGAAVYTITPQAPDVLDVNVAATVIAPQSLVFLGGVWYLKR